ncbi:hypothetical protein [Ruminococcus sp.]|uniref:hypothetical protein n=1 Tax=Ruminococcus sp. TaxID=41978 RepID=UPI0025F7484A|nr:hypothetical protein [Ruminococcus sp.]
MRNTWKKTAAFVLSLALVAGSLPANVGGFLTGSTGIVANAETEIIDSGNFGGVKWTLDNEGLLYITGSGSIPDRAFCGNDWGNASKVKRVVFAEDCAISSIGNWAFVSYVESSQMTYFEINSTVPISLSEEFIFCYYDNDPIVDIIITAPEISNPLYNPIYVDTKLKLIFNVKKPVAFSEGVFSDAYFRDDSIVAIPSGSYIYESGHWHFDDEFIQERYNDDPDNFFWWLREDPDSFEELYGCNPNDLVEGQNYRFVDERKEVITFANRGSLFGEYSDGILAISVNAKDPTCMAEGNTEYYSGSNGEAYLIEGKEFNLTPKEAVTIPATGHTYKAPKWTWEESEFDDSYIASANFTCEKDDDVQTIEAKVTSETIAPTYTADGKTIYTAKATFEGVEYTDTKEISIAKLPLTHHEAVAPSCTVDGSIEYWYDEANKKYFTDNAGNNEITQADTIIESSGHKYGEPVWTWSNDFSKASVKFVCDKCGSEETTDVQLSEPVITNATYDSEGSIVYTAKATFLEKEYTDTQTVVLAKLVHPDIAKAEVAFTNGDTFTQTGDLIDVDYALIYNGKVLVEGQDYEMFEGDKSATKPGTYMVKIRGIGEDFVGEKTIPWYIIPAAVNISVNGAPVDGFEFGKSFTVTADAAPAGQKFSHWAVNNEPVCYSEEYSFIVNESVDLTPVYVADTAVVEAKPVLTLGEIQTVYNGKNAISFEFTHTTPDSYTIEEVGLLYATNKLAGANTSDPKYANTVDLRTTDFDVETSVKNNISGKVKKFVAAYTNHNGTISFSYAIGNNTDCYVYAVGYIKCKNDNNEEVTLYTNFTAVTYNSIS